MKALIGSSPGPDAKTLRRSLGVTLLCGALGAGAVGCVDDSGPSTTTVAPHATTRLALSAHVDEDLDVVRVAFDIVRVSCAGEAFTPLTRSAVVELLNMDLPNDVVDVESVVSGAGHRFTDHFELLPAGCYDVTIRPLGADGSLSTSCVATTRKGVEVRDGKTTEILLLSQCGEEANTGDNDGSGDSGAIGGKTGGLDTIAALNHAPVLRALTFNPSKFAAACSTTTICATAYDADGDDLEFEWKMASGADAGAVPVVVSAAMPRAMSAPSASRCVPTRQVPMAITWSSST